MANPGKRNDGSSKVEWQSCGMIHVGRLLVTASWAARGLPSGCALVARSLALGIRSGPH